MWAHDGQTDYIATNAKALTGYWVCVAEGYGVFIDGSPAFPIVHIREGPNLIGVAARCPAPHNPTAGEMIVWWDAVSQEYREVAADEILIPGRGYWMLATSDRWVRLGR